METNLQRAGMTEVDRDELVRDVYAHFGLALYSAQVLEHGLANAMAFAAIAAGRLPTLEDYDAFLAQTFDRTLGGLIDCERHTPERLPSGVTGKSRVIFRNNTSVTEHVDASGECEFTHRAERGFVQQAIAD